MNGVIDGIPYILKREVDFEWIHTYGQVVEINDQTGSGCICFHMRNEAADLFVKVAGCDTVNGEVSPEESVSLLQHARQVYEDIKHLDLIVLKDHFALDNAYVAVFDYAKGECLFDHRMIDFYRSHPETDPPITRFRRLPDPKKNAVCEKILSLMETVVKAGYVPVDFYDASILYDFANDTVKFCDIDLFVKMPWVNTIGKEYWGSSRFKAPEECIKGETIDERTAVFMTAAVCGDLLFVPPSDNIKARYKAGRYVQWDFPDCALAKVLKTALSEKPDDRYQTIRAFYDAFLRAQETV